MQGSSSRKLVAWDLEIKTPVCEGSISGKVLTFSRDLYVLKGIVLWTLISILVAEPLKHMTRYCNNSQTEYTSASPEIVW